MNEYQRMQYLDAMGIDMFVPRWRLPHAGQSAQLQVAVDAAADSAVAPFVEQALAEPAAQGAPADIPRVKSVARMALVSDATPAAADTPPVAPVFEAPLEIEGIHLSPISFSLEIWQAQGLLMVDAYEPASGLPTAALLQNILKALVQSAVLLPGSELIHWPMVDLPHKPQHLTAAREMMHPLLEAKLPRATRGVLLFGEDAFRVIAADADLSQGFEQACYTVVSLDARVDAVVLPSLGELLRNPRLKARVWQALQSMLL